jgi:hypothetical protein
LENPCKYIAEKLVICVQQLKPRWSEASFGFDSSLDEAGEPFVGAAVISNDVGESVARAIIL